MSTLRKPSFNFKSKLADQSEVLSEANNNEPSKDTVFEKPQRAFKLKRNDENSLNNGSENNPVESLKPSNEVSSSNQSLLDAENNKNKDKDDSGYSFSTSSRVSRVRGRNNQDTTTNETSLSYNNNL